MYITDTQLAASNGASLVGFIQDDPAAVTQTAQNKLRERVSLTDFGVLANGSDDGPRLLAALQYQQASGCILDAPAGRVVRIETWTRFQANTPLYLEGNGATFLCATGASSKPLFELRNAFSITGCVFDGWFRVVDNDAVTATIDHGVFTGNRCVNATPNASSFAHYLKLPNPIDSLWVSDNIFLNAKVTPIDIGTDVLTDQPSRRRITIRNNRIDGVTIGVGPAQIFGMIVVGSAVLIEGNDIRNVDVAPNGAIGSNGAYGIYVKATFCRVVNNHVQGIGTNTHRTNADPSQIVGINLKGYDRDRASIPHGYAQLAMNNTVVGIGGDGYGAGFSTDHLGTMIADNWIENVGYIGISLSLSASQTTATDPLRAINNTVLMRASGGFAGIDAAASRGSIAVQNNSIDGGSGPCVRLRPIGAPFASALVSGNQLRCNGGIGIQVSSDNYDLNNVNVLGNVLLAGAYGLYANDGGGGASFNNVNILDNDFAAASITSLAGAKLASCRIRANKGYVSENGGMSLPIASGGKVAHGLAGKPVSFFAIPTGAVSDVRVVADVTDLTVTYSGTGPIAFSWGAQMPNVFA